MYVDFFLFCYWCYLHSLTVSTTKPSKMVSTIADDSGQQYGCVWYIKSIINIFICMKFDVNYGLCENLPIHKYIYMMLIMRSKFYCILSKSVLSVLYNFCYILWYTPTKKQPNDNSYEPASNLSGLKNSYHLNIILSILTVPESGTLSYLELWFTTNSPKLVGTTMWHSFKLCSVMNRIRN